MYEDDETESSKGRMDHEEVESSEDGHEEVESSEDGHEEVESSEDSHEEVESSEDGPGSSGDSNFAGSLPEDSEESLGFASIPSGSSDGSKSIPGTPKSSPRSVKNDLFPQYITSPAVSYPQKTSDSQQGRAGFFGIVGVCPPIPKPVAPLTRFPQTAKDAEDSLRLRQASLRALSTYESILHRALRDQQSYLAWQQRLYSGLKLRIQEDRRTIHNAAKARHYLLDDFDHWVTEWGKSVPVRDREADAPYKFRLKEIKRKIDVLEQDIARSKRSILEAERQLYYCTHELKTVSDIVQWIRTRQVSLAASIVQVRGDVAFLRGINSVGRLILQRRQLAFTKCSAAQRERIAAETAIKKERDDLRREVETLRTDRVSLCRENQRLLDVNKSLRKELQTAKVRSNRDTEQSQPELQPAQNDEELERTHREGAKIHIARLSGLKRKINHSPTWNRDLENIDNKRRQSTYSSHQAETPWYEGRVPRLAGLRDTVSSLPRPIPCVLESGVLQVVGVEKVDQKSPG